MTTVVDDVKRTHGDPVLRRIMALLTVLIILGTAATTASVVSARQVDTASEADVERGNRLTEQLQQQTVNAERRTYSVRQDTRVLLDAICSQIEAVARQAQPPLQVEPCPDLPPIPTPAPAPSALEPDDD